MSVARPVTDVAVLLSYSGDGGVERMMNQLIAGMLAAGRQVDVLVLRTEGGHFRDLPANANVIRLGPSHAARAVPALSTYLRDMHPPVLLAAKDRAGRAALLARKRAGVSTRVFLRVGNTLSHSLSRHGRLRRWLRLRPIRRLYPLADGLIAVSRGVAHDIASLAPVEADRIHVIANPVVTPQLLQAGQRPPPHSWFTDGGAPVILGVGRLTPQKDFPTLLRAFARLRSGGIAARLLILGEGSGRAELLRLADELGIASDLSLPGFVDDAPACMAAARLFVLSSAWEGSPNALTEAMALGTPVVATDCPSGPAELLDGGRIAPLVPVGDDAALADAIRSVLQQPPGADTLRTAVRDCTVEYSTAHYLRVLEDGVSGC